MTSFLDRMRPSTVHRPIHAVRTTRARSSRFPSTSDSSAAALYDTQPHWAHKSWQHQDELSAGAVTAVPLQVPCEAGSSRAVTLTTQYSLDRWHSLQRVLFSWEGPVSVAVYIPAPRGTSEAQACERLLSDLLDQLPPSPSTPRPHPSTSGSAAPGPCCTSLHISLLYANHHAREGFRSLEQYLQQQQQQPGRLPPLPPPTPPPLQPCYDELYPINALRNAAISGAATELVLLVDGDFAVSRGAAQQAAMLWDRLVTSSCRGPVMIVLPTFEAKQAPGAAADAAAEEQGPPGRPGALRLPRSKQELAEAWQRGEVDRFHCGKWPPLEASIDHRQWLARGSSAGCGSTTAAASGCGDGGGSCADATLLADLADEVIYHEYWEPVGITCRSALPRYDPRFKGYGLNKVQHAHHLAALGFRFLALREHFVVTAPHARSPSFNSIFGTSADPLHLDRVQALYQAFKAELQNTALGQTTGAS